LVDSVSIALIISAAIILIGFLANYLFSKTGIPDMLILIFIGVLCGPIFGVFDPTAIQSFAPYIAALALAYILFDGGMNLNIKQVLSNSPKALLLASLGFVFSVLGVAAFMMNVFNVPLLYGLLFGSIVGGSSSVVVISLASKVKISERGKITLILESALTDILCIVISLSLIDIMVTGQADVGAVFLGITGKFLIGIGIGLALGIAWLFALKKVATLPFSYILTLGIVMLGYAGSESLGGSGALSALIFGLILGNERGLLNVFRQNGGEQNEKILLSVSTGLKRFGAEIAFLIRTFFFVFLGIIVSISSVNLLLSGIVISFILLGTRFGAVWITTTNSPMRSDRKIMTVVLTRGLAAAVLATLPAQYNLEYADLFVGIAVVIIITTAVIATVGSLVMARKEH
jgi:potassium/hydrogen antiporter